MECCYNSIKVQETLKECINKLNLATVKYAKYQKKWLTKRLASTFTEHPDVKLMTCIVLNDKTSYEDLAYQGAMGHYS